MTSLLTDWRDRPTHRRVWALAAPMILSNISVPLVALVDSMVIGHLPHAHQLGAVAVGASLYTFYLGTTGPGSFDLGSVVNTTNTSLSVTNLPTNGLTVYARLWTRLITGWQPVDYTYTEQ